jgi:thiamine-monophosphate kinase
MKGEDHLIERIARAVPSIIGRRSGGTLGLGIGDDAAILSPKGTTEWVLTCDAFLEGVHFLDKWHSADSVGYKSLARATSDITAMGAVPRFFLLTLALPHNRTAAWLDEFLRGMARAARQLGIKLVGGDTTKNPRVLISITVLGEVAPSHALTRAGARPGDLVYVSGRLGRAQLGLELIRTGLGRRRPLQSFVRPHLYPKIRVELGNWLARNGAASATIDLSDGLSTDLTRLCAASEVGAHVRAGRVPGVIIPARLSKHIGKLRLDPFELALHGGDDYELLFTVHPRQVKRLRGAPGFHDLTAIGEITRDKRIFLLGADGRTRRLQSRGWDPFRHG